MAAVYQPERRRLPPTPTPRPRPALAPGGSGRGRQLVLEVVEVLAALDGDVECAGEAGESNEDCFPHVHKQKLLTTRTTLARSN